jgi:asparagine synthase (glutamine-hydrolysing)
MCGICGIYHPAGVGVADVQPMIGAIAHRGPDDEGILVRDCIGLGHRRLSIIDLDGGRQPISNEDDTIWVICNGEIYNYRELRSKLQQKGHIFRTRTDTEVILHLYEEYGQDAIKHLGGMFALALWDVKRQLLLLARDRLGQKPLFYAWDGERLLFASEVKAILAANHLDRDIDYEALHHYLSLRFIPPPHTMFRQVKKLPAAHRLVFQQGTVTVSRYWDLSFDDKSDLAEPELMDALQAKLVETIRSHLISDVPIGAFLSGGMDSSMIVAVMAQELQASFKTFAIGVKEQSYNELPYARQVADHCHTSHVERCVEADLIRLLPTMIWHLDEPSDPIAACQYHAADLAAEHVKVVLGGDGGDELFAGFDRYLGALRVEYYRLIPSALRERAIGPLLDRLPDSFGYKNMTQKLLWAQRLARFPDMGRRYAEATSFFRFSHRDKEVLFGRELWRQVGHLDSANILTEAFDHAHAVDPIDRMLYTDLVTRLPEHSLMLTDRMTMAHGLEGRSPFLDHELVEFMATVPSRLKIRGHTLKYALRKLGQSYLPNNILRRGKQGFMFPIAAWFRDELYPFVERFLLESHLVREGLLNRESVECLLREHRAGQADHHVRLWMLLNVEIWRQLYVEGCSCAAVEERIRSDLQSLKESV